MDIEGQPRQSGRNAFDVIRVNIIMFKVIVTPGNNSGLVKKVLLQRGNW